MPGLDNYYNRFDPAKNYDLVMIRDGYVVQGAEMNEMQSGFQHRLRGVADALFKDGDVIRDGRIVVAPDSGATACEAGAVYLKGAVRGVPAAALTIPVTGVVAVGIYLQERIVTELEDPSLLNPAIGSRAEGEPGAARLRVDTAWGFAGDGQAGEFYPVYTVEDGVPRAKEPPPNLDAVTQALARYDRDNSGGSYVVSGLYVQALPDDAAGRQVYAVAEGRARVDGYGVETATGRRVVHDTQPDLRYIDSEPHLSAGPQAQRIEFDRPPAGNIVQARITAQKTVTLTHGGYTGCQDPLPDASALAILSVTQGGTTYVQNTDYRLTAGKVDWSLAGAEPATGSAYSCTYQYIAGATPAEANASGFTVEGAVAGTLVLVSYNQMLPRIDRLCLSPDGALVWITGVASDWSPRPPAVPSGLLALASVRQTWDASRTVVCDGVRMVPMSDIASLDARLDALAAGLAEQRLRSDAQLREAGVKRGMFVDPFLDDSMRDQGIPQTGAVVAGELTLPVAPTVHPMSADISGPQALECSLVPALSQTARTGSMKVNPYMAFDPIPAQITLISGVDRWPIVETEWTSPITERLIVGSGNASTTTTSQTTRVVAETRAMAERLRQVEVRFELRGFGPNEALSSVTFDGVPVEALPL